MNASPIVSPAIQSKAMNDASRWVDMSRSLKDWVALEAPRNSPPKPLARPEPSPPALYQGHLHAQRQR